MAESATVLLVKATGHVLATLTRAGDPGGKLAPADLAGERFPVRTDAGDVRVEIDSAELDVQSVPLTEDLLLQPQQCFVDQGQAQLGTDTVSITTFDANGVEVTTQQAVTKQTVVLVQVDTGTGSAREHTTLSREIAPNRNSVQIAHTFAPGAYDVLVLASGFKPHQSSETVP